MSRPAIRLRPTLASFSRVKCIVMTASWLGSAAAISGATRRTCPDGYLRRTGPAAGLNPLAPPGPLPFQSPVPTVFTPVTGLPLGPFPPAVGADLPTGTFQQPGRPFFPLELQL